MNKKKRIIIYSIAIFLLVAGFACLIIAATIQDTNRKYANIIGLSSFGIWGLALVVLLINYKNMVTSMLMDLEEKIRSESDFFSIISISETPQTLEDRFIKSGFMPKQEYLHKRQFSLSKDYINYYVAVAQEENITEYFEDFLKKASNLFQDQSRFHKNNVIYLFLFINRDITQEESDYLKTVIINQEVMQRLPENFDTVLPIIYNIANQEYIIRKSRRKFSIALFDKALRKYYKMIKSA